ncbi:MAG: acyl-CoA dehydrogenase family protein [Acidimicrobiia bacterium]
MTTTSEQGEAGFRAWVHAELATRLGPRRPDRPVSVLGAGNDDLDAGHQYLEALTGSGLAVPAWPREYGGLGATPAEVAIVRRELADFDVPDLYPYLVGLELIGPTLLAHATPEQCARWLPPIAAGTEIWCQLFSEPGAGSDLAGLATRAHAEGDQWRLHGQKVWTSRGAYAQYGLMLARHDPTVPKHQGITAFGLEMRTPGLDVRPLRQMNGDAHFTEVFLDDARLSDADRIGTVGEGWRVALTCLSFERGAATAGSSGGLLDVDRLIALAQTRGIASDPAVRDALARLVIELRVMAMTIRRARDTARTGQPGPAGSGLKLRGSRTFRDYTNLALRILGADALTAAEPWNTLFLTAPSLSIRGGTDEIQRNIVGERVLGLPEEPRLDRNVPFEQLPR